MLKNKTGFSFMAAPNKQTNSHKVLLLLMYCDFFVASFWWQTVLGYHALVFYRPQGKTEEKNQKSRL